MSIYFVKRRNNNVFLKMPRQKDREGGTLSRSGGDHEVPALEGDDLPGQVESDADAGDAVYRCLPVEAPEDGGEIGRAHV